MSCLNKQLLKRISMLAYPLHESDLWVPHTPIHISCLKPLPPPPVSAQPFAPPSAPCLQPPSRLPLSPPLFPPVLILAPRPVSPAASPPFSNPQPNLTFRSLRSGSLWMDRRPRSCQPRPVPTTSLCSSPGSPPSGSPLYLAPEFPLPAPGAQPFLSETLVLPILHLFPLPPSCYLLVSFLN